MNSISVDWVTLTLKPGVSGASLSELLDTLLDCFFIKSWLPWFDFMCSNHLYEQILRFNDVSLKISYSHNYEKEGICLDFSGGGLDYYREYLETINVDLRTAFCRFIALSSKGYKGNCSRIDIACDDFGYNGSSGLLNLDVIENCLLSRSFVSFFRKGFPDVHHENISSIYSVDPKQLDKELNLMRIKSLNISSCEVGKTIYLGKRGSSTFIRFYDKLVEQHSSGHETPEGLTHWVRFEPEFRKKNAAAVFENYALADSDDSFREWFAGVILYKLRFVDLDRSRRYNCSVCDWWISFLGSSVRVPILIKKPKRNAFLRARHYQIKQNACSIAEIASHDFNFLSELIEAGLSKTSKSRLLIRSDYNALNGLSPGDYNSAIEHTFVEVSGEDYWRSFVDSSKVKFNIFLRHLYNALFMPDVGDSCAYQ